MSKPKAKVILPVLVTLCLVALLTVWVIRVRHVNASADQAEWRLFEMGETVPLGDDYFFRKLPQPSALKVKVTGARIVPYADYIKEMKLDEEKLNRVPYRLRPEYIYDVALTIYCDGETQDNDSINLMETLLVTDNMRLALDLDIFDQLQPQLEGSASFRLRSNTQMDFHFPYRAETEGDQKVATFEFLSRRPFYLGLTLYPVKKMIRIVPDLSGDWPVEVS